MLLGGIHKWCLSDFLTLSSTCRDEWIPLFSNIRITGYLGYTKTVHCSLIWCTYTLWFSCSICCNSTAAWFEINVFAFMCPPLELNSFWNLWVLAFTVTFFGLSYAGYLTLMKIHIPIYFFLFRKMWWRYVCCDKRCEKLLFFVAANKLFCHQ